MSVIEKIQQYIGNTKHMDNTDAYSLKYSEWEALYKSAKSCGENAVDAIEIAFNYGRAKGERHARNEVKKA